MPLCGNLICLAPETFRQKVPCFRAYFRAESNAISIGLLLGSPYYRDGNGMRTAATHNQQSSDQTLTMNPFAKCSLRLG